MATSYQTPGVYVEEIPVLPVAIEQVATAIPVFIGFTEKSVSSTGDDLLRKPFRIHSFPEYVQCYGEAAGSQVDVMLNSKNEPIGATLKAPSPFLLSFAVRHFFDNDGGPCYIFSTGSFLSGEPALPSLYDDSTESSALTQTKQVDEITLLVFPDLAVLGEEGFYDVYNKALKHCAEAKDRFLIMDIFQKQLDGAVSVSASVSTFIESMPDENRSYAAAYVPNLVTNYTFNHRYCNMHFIQAGGMLNGMQSQDAMLLIALDAFGKLLQKSVAKITKKNSKSRLQNMEQSWYALLLSYPSALMRENLSRCIGLMRDGYRSGERELPESTRIELNKLVEAARMEANERLQATANHKKITGNSFTTNLAVVKRIFTKTFQTRLQDVIREIFVELPPSAAVAGVYANVDSTRGVWKAPTSVALASVTRPVMMISDSDQSNLNLTEKGISINAIRTFSGKGVLVWGARTLDGNSNEWRYVSIRRFFMMMEESIDRGLQTFVFEPNNVTTWVSVKGTISNFLITQWRNGALMGIKPDQAFFIKVGLNETMTQQDILEGRLIVEIGMAAVRPAEFVILRFCVKMLAET